MHSPLTDQQLNVFSDALDQGAEEASRSLGVWLNTPSLVQMGSVRQLPFDQVSELLGPEDETIGYCVMAVDGALQGQMMFAFDLASGLTLTRLLLGPQHEATIKEMDEVAISAAMETTNIVGCAYLNALAESCGNMAGQSWELIPSPPRFGQEFAASLLQSVFMEQLAESDQAISAEVRFELRGERVNWHLLFVPDSGSVRTIAELSSKGSSPPSDATADRE